MKFSQKIKNEQKINVSWAYGMTMAPRREIAKAVAPFPLRDGTKRPLKTSDGFGFA